MVMVLEIIHTHKKLALNDDPQTEYRKRLLCGDPHPDIFHPLC